MSSMLVPLDHFKSLILPEYIENCKVSSNDFTIDIKNEEFFIYKTNQFIKNIFSDTKENKDRSFIIEKSAISPNISNDFEKLFINTTKFEKFNSVDYLFIKKFLILLSHGEVIRLNNLSLIMDNFFNEKNYFNYLLHTENKESISLNISEKLICCNNLFTPLMRIKFEDYDENLNNRMTLIMISKYESKLYLKIENPLSSENDFIELDKSIVDAYFQFFKHKPTNLNLMYFNPEDINSIEIKSIIFY